MVPQRILRADGNGRMQFMLAHYCFFCFKTFGSAFEPHKLDRFDGASCRITPEQGDETLMIHRIHAFVILSCFAVAACQQSQAPQAPPPPQVKVIVTRTQEVAVPIEFVGQIFGAEDIAIRARVEGFLEGIHFEEGSEVELGKLLYTIESQPYEADVAAMLSKVAEAKTVLAKTASDLNRIRPLAARKAVSESDLDAAQAAYDAAQASVDAAEANLRAANIKLSYTRILSPIDGLIGKTNAKVGDFVGRSPNPVILNTVSNITTVRVEFFLTENQYLKMVRRIRDIQEGKIPPAERNPVEMILADESLYPYQGEFDFIDRNIDPTTGSILVQVSFPNPDKMIRPGQFARIRTIADTIPNGILIPQRCVSELQGIQRVFVVGNNNKIEERRIERGPAIGSNWLILDGLNAGEKVVYEGLQRVSDGVEVKPEVVTADTPEKEKQS
jgi:membrane fusion protein (multidrug efflux system)